MSIIVYVRKRYETSRGKEVRNMKHYWVNKKLGTTNTTWGDNMMDPNLWVEITKEEKDARDAELLKAWAERYNGEG